MTKDEFLKKYVLARTSHKRTLDELLQEALKAWEFIENNK
jgi:hypothetical protein